MIAGRYENTVWAPEDPEMDFIVVQLGIPDSDLLVELFVNGSLAPNCTGENCLSILLTPDANDEWNSV